MEKWMEQVREALALLTDGEIGHEDDLPDWGYADAYERGASPAAAATAALKAAGF